MRKLNNLNKFKEFNTSKHFAPFAHKLLCLLFCAIICVSMTIPNIVYAVTQDELDKANQALEDLRNQQSSLSSELNSLNKQFDEAADKLSAIENDINAKQAKIDNLQIELDEMNAEKNKQYEAMKLRIKYMYEHGSAGALELLLNADNFSELLTNAEYVLQISSYDRKMLTKFDELIKEQEQTETQLLADMNALNELKTQAEQEADNIKNLITQKQSEINTSSDNIAKAEQLALEYEKKLEQERLAREEAERLKAEQEAAANSGLSSSDNNSATGSGSVAVDNVGNSNVNYGDFYVKAYDYDETDLAMLAAILECESGDQSYEGIIAVGSVIMNRVDSPHFSNTISGVIFAPGQFSPVTSGRFAIVLARGPKEICVKAAKKVLEGRRNVDALYFRMYNPNRNWNGLVIDDHIFMKTYQK